MLSTVLYSVPTNPSTSSAGRIAGFIAQPG